MDINKLNNKQKEAVINTEGPLLILAGAGSGKTRVLTYKVAYLIEEKKIEPYNILAITFTNKAAKEMKDRINFLIGEKFLNIQISTFHSFGYKIIRENYKLLDYKSNFTILDSDDSVSVIKKVLKELNLDPKYYNPVNIKNKISSAKNEFIDCNEYQKYANTLFEKTIANIYTKYNNILFKNNSVDFDDLLILPIKLFKEYPNVLMDYQEKYKYILIDEYQDTNEAQYILTKMISAKHKNICVVGDGDQSIYSFRGANYKNILNFENDYKDAKVILLEENYRSTQNILSTANKVIKNNKNRKEKNLFCQNEEGLEINYYRAYDERNEVEYVIKEINKKILEKNITYNDIAILYRTNAQSRIFEEELLKANIPFKVVGGFNFYRRKEIKSLINYLKLIYNEKDDVSLLEIINVPRRGIGEVTINKLSIKSQENNKCIYDVINSGKELQFKEIIEYLRTFAKNNTLTNLIEEILNKSGMKEELKSEKSIEADIRLENLEEFKSISRSFEEVKGIISLEDFLMELALVNDVNEQTENKEQINLMTAHSVKGLEFNIVFIVGLEEGIFPHINSLFDNHQIEEERRLCYVAITRAKKELYFINAKRRLLYGKNQANPVSRFIIEAGCDSMAIREAIKEQTLNKEDYLYDSDIEYNAGDKVEHKDYGEGTIIEITKDIITIAFKHPYQIKKMMKNHKSIKKISV